MASLVQYQFTELILRDRFHSLEAYGTLRDKPVNGYISCFPFPALKCLSVYVCAIQKKLLSGTAPAQPQRGA